VAVAGRGPRREEASSEGGIAAAVGLVLAIKAWVVNPYRIPSSSMEPTLHCARPAPGCLARFSDRVLANRRRQPD
jgi:signal peptidase I